jgi:Ion channel
MIMGRFSTRAVLFTSIIGLLAIVTGGGTLLAVAEGVEILDGIWLAFNVVTTTGFGSGPRTAMGQLLSMGLFALGASCWFGTLLVVIEIANLRFQKYSLIDEALRPLAKRPHSRLFHVN